MNLDEFPTSETALRMLSRVSPVYDRAYIAKWLYQVMGLELDQAWSWVEELQNQAFPETATWGVPCWEQRYQLPIDATQPLSSRRRKLLTRRYRRTPINPARIEATAYAATGLVARVTQGPQAYTFHVWLSGLPDATAEARAKSAIDKIRPAHLAYDVQYEREVNATFGAGGVFTHGRTFTIRQVN